LAGGGVFEKKVLKMRLLSSSCLSVCPYVSIREHLNEFSSNMVQIGHQQRTLKT